MDSSPRDERPSVLIVDDEPSNLLLLSELLRGSYRVKVANSGERALAYLGEGQLPDLVLLDINMAGISGYEVLRGIRAGEATRAIPVVFITGLDSIEEEERGLAMGASDYIAKPISPPLVLARVRIQLENKAAADFLRDKNAYLEAEAARRTREVAAAHEAALRALAEKEALLRELFHRTRNNMQVIASILAFEAEGSGDSLVAAVVEDTTERIMAMSLVQKKLYESRDLSRIDLREYLVELVDALAKAEDFPRGRIAVSCPAEPLPALFDVAVPCGLALRELISGVLRRAFREGEEGGIKISIARSEGGEVEILVEDEGSVAQEEPEPGKSAALGLRLVRNLVEQQLRGSFSIGSGKGFSCRIAFSDSHYAARL